LNDRAMEIDELEQNEVISYLPDINGKNVLELGAGIGRYTQHLASLAQWVTAVDFVEKFIEQNKINNSDRRNITYYCNNVIALEFSSQVFDFIFINWLFMYLEDEEVKLLIDRLYNYLKPECKFFLRESCVQPSNPNAPHPNTYYRDPKFYENLLLEKFNLVSKGNVLVYEHKFNNPNQIFWLLQKK
ncbi:MAG TPA: methyltransferase domain-containing protein, partial [Allocoleopsis sp.]